MNTIPFTKKENSGKDSHLSEEMLESTGPYPLERNITDGGEFLNDDLRMEEQPYNEKNWKTSESIFTDPGTGKSL